MSNITTLDDLKQQIKQLKELKLKEKAELKLKEKADIKLKQQYLKLSKVKSSLHKIKLNEEINPLYLKYLIASPFLLTQKYETFNDTIYENEKDFLLKYQMKLREGKVVAEYKQSKHKYGRVYVDGSLTLGGMRKDVRDALTYDKYVDIDIDNCHCSIIEQILTKINISCNALTEYNNNRNEILLSVMNYYNCDRKTAKSFFLICLYGGNYETFINTHNKREDTTPININTEILPFMKKYYNEIQTITDLIYSHNIEATNEIKDYKEEYKINFDANNIKNSILAFYAQNYERTILEIIYNFLKDKKCIDQTAILIYDGLMIPKNNYYDGLLASITTEIYNKTNFNLTLSIKPIENTFLNKLIEWAESNYKMYEIPNDKKSYICPTYFKTLSNDDKKTYFENFICKIMKPEIFYIYNTIDNKGHTKPCFYNTNNLYDAFKNLKITIDNETEDFINYWLGLDDMKQCIEMVFEPDNIMDKTIYNLYTGFNKDVINHTITDIDKTKKLLNLFNDIILNLVGGDIKHYQYFKNFMADIFQNPSDRKPISILIKSIEGVGKNTILDAYGRLLGDLYITSSNTDDFFSSHAEGFNNKLLVNLNELELNKTKDIQNKLKSFISEDTITINPKNIRPYTVKNYARAIFTTNKDISTIIDSKNKDRRNVIFQATDKYANKTCSSLWCVAREQFKTLDFLKCLYDDIFKTDLREVNLINRPITDLYIETYKYFLPTEIQFLTEFANNKIYDNNEKMIIYKKDDEKDPSRIQKITGSIFYNKYMDFLHTNNFKNQLDIDIRKFYNKIYSLNLNSIKKENSNIIKFNINIKELSLELKNKYNNFDIDFIEEPNNNDLKLLETYGLL